MVFDEWDEPEDQPQIETLVEAEIWGRKVIENFNASLKPHERAREFLGVEIVDEESDKHRWVKRSLTTVMSRSGGRSYDKYGCDGCGITGRRYGLDAHVQRDSDFKAAGFESCKMSKVLLERRRKRAEKKGV
ncbi:hypothetical protein ES705_35250 [subsurface metagenome]